MKSLKNDIVLKIAIVFVCSYYIYAMLLAPIFFTIVFTSIITLVYFTLIRSHRRHIIRHEFLLLFSLVQFRNNANDQKILIWILGAMNNYARNFSENNSLRKDFELFQEFRNSILQFTYNEEFFEQLVQLSHKVEIAIKRKHYFYEIKKYIFNYVNCLRFKTKINLEIKML